MKSLPVPRTVSGWLLSAFLMILSFFIYYDKLFEDLLKHYYDVGNYQNLPPATAYLDNIEVSVLSPQSISRFIAQELIVKVVGVGESTDDVSVIVSAHNIGTQATDSPTNSIVLLCTTFPSDNFTSCEESRNRVDFGRIVKNEEASQGLWVIVSPRVRGDVEKIEFRFYDESGKEIEFNQARKAEIKDQDAVAQSFLRTILLPPWANGFIPILVFLVVHLFEHKIQPGQTLKIRKGKRLNNEIINNSKIQISAYVVVSIILFSVSGIFYGWAIGRNVILALWIVALVISWVAISFMFESTDLQDKDPLYSKSSEPPPCSPIEKNFLNTSEEIKILLNDSGSAQTALETLQKNYKHLPKMEKYFSVLSADSWKNDYVQNVLRKSVAETPYQRLNQCSDPILIRELMKLGNSANAPQLSDQVDLLDGLVGAATDSIDAVLKEELGKREKALRVLDALEKSNRSVKDLLSFFEQFKKGQALDEEEIKKMISALQKNSQHLSEFHRGVRLLLERAEDSSAIEGGTLLNKITDQTFRKNLLEVAIQICMVDLDTARWFIYNELSELSVNDKLLKEEFFRFMQRVVSGLRNNLPREKYPNRSDSFWRIIDHDWDQRDPGNISALPNKIKILYNAALDDSGNTPDGRAGQTSDEKQGETTDDGQNQNSEEGRKPSE